MMYKKELCKRDEEYWVEIPQTIVKLYSLKEGMIFELYPKENKKEQYLLINMATKLDDLCLRDGETQ